MAVNTINIVGQVLPPTGVPDTRSRVFFIMTGYDTDADQDAVIYPVPGVDDADGFQIAADGTIDVDLWPNQEGVRNTLYRVEVSVFQLNRPVRVTIGSISVPNTGGPYNLNDLLGVAPPADATVEEYIASLAAAVAEAESAAATAVAAADSVIGPFSSRSAFETWNAANSADDGVVASDGTVQYVASSGATAIPDLLGWLPFGKWYIQHFGTIDGTSDAAVIAAASLAATAARETLHAKAMQYTIKSQVVLHDELELVGEGADRPHVRGNFNGPVFAYDAALGVTPMIRAKSTTTINGIGFAGTAKGTGTALHVQRDTADGVDYEDTDTQITGCHFSQWDLAVDHWNRGLNFSNNLVQLCDTAVALHWDEANFVDDPGNAFDALPYGYRAIRFNGNRLHICDVAISNVDTDADSLRGLLVSDNLMDAGDVLFNGGLKSGVFDGNVIDITDTQSGAIRITTACDSLTVTGGLIVKGTADPAYMIRCDGNVGELNIGGGLILDGADVSAIWCAGNVSGGTIANLSITDSGDGTTANGCIRIDGSVDRLAIGPVSFDPVAGSPCIVAGGTWTNCSIIGANYDGSATLISGYTDGGGNFIQDRNELTAGGVQTLTLNVTIADDAVGSFVPPRRGFFLKIVASGQAGANPSHTHCGELYLDVGASLRAEKNTGYSTTGTALDVSTSTLTGTTGADGNVTVSAQSDLVQIENRIGATVQFQLSLL